ELQAEGVASEAEALVRADAARRERRRTGRHVEGVAVPVQDDDLRRYAGEDLAARARIERDRAPADLVDARAVGCAHLPDAGAAGVREQLRAEAYAEHGSGARDLA